MMDDPEDKLGGKKDGRSGLMSLTDEPDDWERRVARKIEDLDHLKSNTMAQCSFWPQQLVLCDSFKNCGGLSRVAFMKPDD